MAQSRQTRLQAVNTILMAVGEAPVDTLTNAGVDVAIVENTLDSIDRQVQNTGWTFNIRKLTLSPDSNSNINIPTNILRLEGDKGTHYTIRSGLLYDMTDATNVFTSDISLTVVEMIEFDDLPEAAKDYVVARAARTYADRQLGDKTLSTFTRQDEQFAYMSLRKEHLRTGKYDIWEKGNSRFARRRGPLDSFTSF